MSAGTEQVHYEFGRGSPRIELVVGIPILCYENECEDLKESGRNEAGQKEIVEVYAVLEDVRRTATSRLLNTAGLTGIYTRSLGDIDTLMQLRATCML